MQQLENKLVRIKEIYNPQMVPEGQGATVMRVLGNRTMNNAMDPFLMLDYWCGQMKGTFPDHPHRGFETITYALQGKGLHEDFLGHKGAIEAGDVQWMTAGRGIVHAESPSSPDEFGQGFQLWLNLRSVDKMQPPSYQEIKAAQIPKIKKDGTTVALIAGEALGQKGPIYTRTPAFYIDVRMEKNSTYQQLIPKGFNALLFVYEGQGYFGDKQQLATKEQAVHLQTETDRDQLLVNTKNSECNFLLLAGQPLGEPIAQHGPFVMNTREELFQAFDDYQNCKNGFENARNWVSNLKQSQMKQKKKI